jgi:hypothetical protein
MTLAEERDLIMVSKNKKSNAGKKELKSGRVKVGKLEASKGLSAGEVRRVKGGSVTDLVIDPFTARKK